MDIGFHARTWEAASAVFFLYTLAAALLLRGVSSAGRRRALLFAGAGLAIACISSQLLTRVVLHGWLLPPALLLLAYWASGALFVAPMPDAEDALMGIDRRLGIRALAARTPRPIAEVLELAYAGVYPLIPIALVLHLAEAPRPDAARFWSVILITDYLCFATLPWLQTRPPRALEPGPPWGARLRAFNVGLLGKASIHVNTFPSGHAAEGLAAALLVSGAPAAVVVAMIAAALAIAAGAVLGRYHYALDALTGWAVAVTVWLAVGR